jgi:exopolyphosphatase/guanosine-5'-triphosphate,3'-diphosphate pyrophosphatase
MAGMSTGVPVAAVDCGTNSTRLLVAGGDGLPLVRLMRITRLGQGVDATRRLHPNAVARTLAVLREYREVMDAKGVERVRMTATSAARDAENREALLGPAADVIGVAPELLSGDAEGRLAFAGAVSELDPAAGPYLVLDIGGGSTEFVVGPEPRPGDGETPAVAAVLEPAGTVSVDIGCVRVTERFLHGDPPAPEELSQAISVINAYLDDVERELPAVTGARRLVGLAGTVTTMAAVEMGMATYDRDRIHHFELTREAAEDVFRTLATEPRADRIHNPGLEEARADVIVGGALILVTVMRHFGFASCLVSEADILDGLVLSQVGTLRW